MKNTKQHIIETASNLFYNNGYNLTGINEIIAEAGIAKATLYSHFRSKEDICISYLEYKNTFFLEALENYCNALPDGDQKLLGIFDFLKAFFNDSDFNGCWCIRTVSEIPSDNIKIRNKIKLHKTNFIKLIETLVTDSKPDMKPVQVSNLSKKIYLLYESAVSESHLHNQNWPISIARQMLEKEL